MPDRRAPEYNEADNQPGRVSDLRARAGVTGHNVRYVLGFGLVGVIVAFVIVFLIYV